MTLSSPLDGLYSWLGSVLQAFTDVDLAGAAQAVSSKGPVSYADEHEVQRVLCCASDYEVLKVRVCAVLA